MKVENVTVNVEFENGDKSEYAFSRDEFYSLSIELSQSVAYKRSNDGFTAKNLTTGQEEFTMKVYMQRKGEG